MGVFLLIVLALIIALVVCNIKIVNQGYAYVIETLGKYSGTWYEGLHVKIPFIQTVVRKTSLKEQVLDFPPQSVITKDNVTMKIDSVVFMQVFDPKLFTYGVENPISGLQNLSATTLRSIIGEMELDQTLSSREEINNKMQAILDNATDQWGIKVTRVEIKDITPPHEIEEVMTKQMKAERERRQTVLEAQAHKEAVVSRAQGDKEAKVLAAEAERAAQIALAEGKAKSIELVYQAEANGIKELKKAGIDDSILKLRSIEALKVVADGRATKIYMPTDLAKSVSSLGLVQESLGIGDAMKIDTSKKEELPLGEDICCDDNGHLGKEASITTRRIENAIKKA